jgi:two-component sensor histidine kinase
MRECFEIAKRTTAGSIGPMSRMPPALGREPPVSYSMPGAALLKRRLDCAGATHIRPTDRATVQASSFETLAASSERLARSSGDVFGALLASTYPQSVSIGWAPRPLWNEEAIHRAYRMLQLLLRLRERRHGNEHAWHADYALAMQLGADIRSLSGTAEHRPVPCSAVLCSVVCSLSSLFGQAAGGIDLRTSIERVSLPAYRRRALVLAASELVVNALSHAFNGCAGGRIDVCLQRVTGGCARLRVADDGAGYFEDHAETSASLAGRLGKLLEGRLVYRRDRAWATTAEIVFLIQG